MRIKDGVYFEKNMAKSTAVRRRLSEPYDVSLCGGALRGWVLPGTGSNAYGGGDG